MRCDLSNVSHQSRVQSVACVRQRWKASKGGILAGACLATLLVVGAASASDYTPVTDARLVNPEPANWLMIRGNYKGWSYSPLDRINTSNVKNLMPVWSLSTGVEEGHEAPPIVNNVFLLVFPPHPRVMVFPSATLFR